MRKRLMVVLVMVLGIVLITPVGVKAEPSQPANPCDFAGTGVYDAGGIGKGFINYGNILVTWVIEADGVPVEKSTDLTGSETDVGYRYTWAQDRDLNGNGCEGSVTVDYGRYGGLVTKNEGTTYDDFGLSSSLTGYTSSKGAAVKPLHEEMDWVPGVTVPSGTNRYVMHDPDGDGIYEGNASTILQWDNVTIQGDPPGPYLIKNEFAIYDFDVDEDLIADYGFYIQYQYMKIPGYK